jgi:hypothetical protein
MMSPSYKEKTMKLLLYVVLCFTSFVGGLTIKRYIDINAPSDFVYIPIFATAGALVAIMATITITYVYLEQFGNQRHFGDVLGQVLSLKVLSSGAFLGLAALAIVKLAFAGG